jgi:2-polyprenyl-3-methyl-5-hydroxy-6-metoxy-1,4-benzoquinol methylase
MFNLKASYPYQPENNQVAFDLISKAINGKKDVKNILDVGCGYGLLSKELKKTYPKLNLYGIEHAKEASQSSQKILKLLQFNIEDMALIKLKLKTQKFDVIIFSDVLEHLYDPVGIIKFYQSLLKQDGTIIVTVPNISNIFNRISFLFGYFNYSETGVMDKTHIRFFNRKNLKQLAKESDLKIVFQKYDSIIVRWFVPLIKIFITNNKGSGNILDSKLYQFYFKYLRPIEELFSTLLPSLFAFRLGVNLKRK